MTEMLETPGARALGELALALAQDGSGPSRSLLDYVRQGGEIGLVIILLSFVAVVLIVAAMVQIRMSRLAPPEQVEELERVLRKGDVQAALRYCRADENQSFLTRVFGSALVRCERSAFGFLELKTALEEAGSQQVARLYRITESIGLIASVAPMLGLLGTVVGMVGAFDTIGVTEGPVKPDQLAGNISEALITTVLGLIVAIPATAAFTYLRSRIDSLASEVAEIIEELAAYLETPLGGESGERAQAGAPGPGREPRRAPPANVGAARS